MSEEIRHLKWELRLSGLEKRERVAHDRGKEASEALLKELYSKLQGTILSFASHGSEINLWPLNEKLAAENRLVLPRVEGDKLIPYRVNNINEDLLPSKWNILEPDPEKCAQVPIDEIATILVPGILFDKNHHRLGYGKGFYDGLLKNLKVNTLGVGYQEQLIEQLPQLEHDVALGELTLY